MGDNKNSFFKYVNGKRRTRANIGATVDEDYVTNRDIDRDVEYIFLPLSSTPMMGSVTLCSLS